MSKFKKGDKVVLRSSSYLHRNVFPGDTGVVVDVGLYLLDRETLNVNFMKENKQGPLITLKEQEIDLLERENISFKVGDRVIAVSASHGWAEVSPGDVGIISEIRNDNTILVDFPNHEGWMACSVDLKEYGFKSNREAKNFLFKVAIK